MGKLRRRLVQEEAALGGDAGTMFFTFYCKSGRHRSVACAVIMGQLLEWDGYAAQEIRHLCSEFWSRATFNMCRECRLATPGRDAALARAWQQWNLTRHV
jgi:hypothetical protein